MSGSNCDPLQRSISRIAIAGCIGGRCVCGMVIESYASATARILAPTGISSLFNQRGYPPPS